MVMTYQAALDVLYALQKHGIKLGLDTIGSLLARLENPQQRFMCLHVGGTNGKGSTAAMAASILQHAGYRVGLYTSPHLVDFRERMQVDGAPISEDQVSALTARVRDEDAQEAATFFEFTTAMAFQHFADSGVEVAVIEVGMGGRFDATNIVTPLVAAITNVSLDHQEFLGPTLSAIAFEKAGIIKEGVPVVVGRLRPEAACVIERVAHEQRAPQYRWGTDFYAEGDPEQGFHYEGVAHKYEQLTCPLAGAHQLENAACAIAMVELAQLRAREVSEEAIRRGLRAVAWGGRLERVESGIGEPTLLLDGAHNVGAAEVIRTYVSQYRQSHPESRVILLVGMMRDKDHKAFLRLLLPLADEVILTQAQLARAASVEELCQSVGDWPIPIHRMPGASDALALARHLGRKEDLICATGSLILVGEMKAILQGCGLSSIRG
jgi:dihydrofolate synthase/folylpolyglutamate synthase